MQVKDYMRSFSHLPLIVHESEKTEAIAQRFLDDPKTRTIFVTDSKGIYRGYLTIHALMDCLLIDLADGDFFASGPEHAYQLLRNTETAKDIMDSNPVSVTPDSSITQALTLMKQHRMGEIPVIDPQGKIVEELHVLEVLQFWKTQKSKGESRHV